MTTSEFLLHLIYEHVRQDTWVNNIFIEFHCVPLNETKSLFVSFYLPLQPAFCWKSGACASWEWYLLYIYVFIARFFEYFSWSYGSCNVLFPMFRIEVSFENFGLFPGKLAFYLLNCDHKLFLFCLFYVKHQRWGNIHLTFLLAKFSKHGNSNIIYYVSHILRKVFQSKLKVSPTLYTVGSIFVFLFLIFLIA